MLPKFKLFIGCQLLCLSLAGCLGSSGQTPCKVRAVYILQNARVDTVVVKTVDSSIAWTGLDVTTLIRNSNAEILPGNIFRDTVDYEWTGVHGCAITNGTRDVFRVCSFVTKHDSLLSRFFFSPIDSTQNLLDICTDCLQYVYDTVIIH